MAKNTSKTTAKGLDHIDREIVKLLQEDGRIPNTEIAKTIGISEGTVRTRLSRLIGEEFIQIVAVSNPIKLGFQVVGTIRVHVDITKLDEITEKLTGLKPLWYIVHTTGGTGIDAEFVVKSIDDLNDLIFEKINRIDGVIRTETTLILKFIKRQYDWSTSWD